MKRPLARLARLLLLLAAPLAAGADHDIHTSPHATASGDLRVSAAWARATLAGLPVGAAYLTITNQGARPDTLLALSSPVAARTELHRTLEENGISRMRPAGEIEITAGQSIQARPGGLHVMFSGLTRPLVAGSRVPLTLQFRNAGSITVEVEVVAATATAPDSGGTQGHSPRGH